MNKKAQVTVFIILAIVIVGVIVAYYAMQGGMSLTKIPASIEPAYTNFLSCLEQETLIGINVLESRGGYIELPDFEPGSTYMPFSSQLEFVGNSIPYWYYVSGNNIQKEQIPSKKQMQDQLGDFVERKISGCNFDSYYDQGFEIELGEPSADVSVKNKEVRINLKMDLIINKEDDNAVVDEHEISVKSNLGSLYDSARKVYEKEQEELFLENYGVDVLRSYAPVDGVEVTCSPKIWDADEVFDELEEAIEANTLALKSRGVSKDYFVVDLGVQEEVRFINSKDWPSNFEVDPTEGALLIATPVGNQPGLGVLGFCYVPYHFVYDLGYPVLIQIYDGDEIFQFPVAVVLQGNKPRQALEVSAVEFEASEVCKHKNTNIEVNVYDTSSRSLDADISYECLGEVCYIGETSGGFLEDDFPQCVNGVVLARAEGYKDERVLYSVISSGSVDVFLDKLYELDVELKLGNRDYDKRAIISFISEDHAATVVYPEQKGVKLSEGQYEIQVQAYKDSSLKIPASNQEQCMEVPRSGVLGIFGLTQEKCFNIEMPSQTIDNSLAGGGKQNYYILESELQSSSVVEINADSLPTPDSLEQLQDNYLLFENKGLEIMFE